MKRSQQGVPGALTGAVPTDNGFSSNVHNSSTQWRNKGGRNATTNEARRGAGQLAPRPQSSKQPLLSSSGATASSQAGLARVKNAGSGDQGARMPVQSPPSNITGTKAPYGGQGQPPAARGGAPGLRAGGRNQTWPNGPMYTDSAKKGSSGKDSGPIATRKPARRGKGAPFYGEY